MPEKVTTPLNATQRQLAEQAYQECSSLLGNIARKKMAGLRLKCTSEDVVISSVRSLISQMADGRYQFQGTGKLKSYLIKIVVCKVCQKYRYETAEKRGGKARLVDPVQRGFDNEEVDVLASIADRAYLPDICLAAEELYQDVLNLCRDDFERQCVELSSQDYEDDKIAKEAGKSSEDVRDCLGKIYDRYRGLKSSDVFFEKLSQQEPFQGAAKRAGWSETTARKVLNNISRLWQEEKGEPLDLYSQHNIGQTLVELRRCVRTLWLDDLVALI